MELEEAIEKINEIKKEYSRFDGLTEYVESIDFVINHITKQEKMIELMTEYIMYKVPFTKETRCLELKEDARTLNSVKQYFEKKAEENL